MKSIKMIAGAACICAGALASCGGGATAPAEGNAAPASDTEAVIENIMTRMSVRQFTDQPVAKDTLDLIVRAGMAAPSARDARPWSFIVVTDKEVLDSLNANHPYANLKTATAAIIVCGDAKADPEKGVNEYWVQDCSAATENILLAAHAYGLGAVWCGVYPNEERIAPVKRILSIPEDWQPLNIITMGWPDDPNAKVKDKWNEANVHYNKW